LTETQSDIEDARKQTVIVAPVLSIGLPTPEHYRNAALVDEYRSVVKQTLNIFCDVQVNASRVLHRHLSMLPGMLDIAQGVVDMELRLALALPFPGELYDKEKKYNKVSVVRFGSLLPHIRVDQLIKRLAPEYDAASIIIIAPKHLERLSLVLGGTPEETLQAFLVWKVIQRYADHVEHPSLNKLKTFNAKLTRRRFMQSTERWRRCLRDVDNDFGGIISRTCGEEHFSDCSQSAVGNTIEASFIDTKARFPAREPNAAKEIYCLEKYYSGLTLDEDLYFRNKILLAQAQTKRQWAKLIP